MKRPNAQWKGQHWEEARGTWQGLVVREDSLEEAALGLGLKRGIGIRQEEDEEKPPRTVTQLHRGRTLWGLGDVTKCP